MARQELQWGRELDDEDDTMNMEEDARVEEEMVVILLLEDDDACLEGEWMGMVVTLFIFGASRRR